MSLYRYLTMNVNDGCSAHSGQSALEIVWRGKTRIGTERRAYRHQLPKSSAIEKLASVARDTSIEYSAPRCHLRISYAKKTLHARPRVAERLRGQSQIEKRSPSVCRALVKGRPGPGRQNGALRRKCRYFDGWRSHQGSRISCRKGN